MQLTTRLTLFFLITLAVVLGGFSTALYFLARGHLYQQADERLEAALNTLVAAVEIGPDGMEWEPAERHLRLGSAAFGEQLVWQVSDEQGQKIDGSDQPEAEALLRAAVPLLPPERHAAERLSWQGKPWQFSRRSIHQPPSVHAPASPRAEVDEGRKYARLGLTVGLALEPIEATLQRLLGALVGLSLAVWLLALFVSRAVCRRALRPVTVMAAAARGMSVDELGTRLSVPSRGDELDELSQAFNGLLDRLQEAVERQRRFTGDASHQLRTPLTAILGQIEVTLRRQRSSAEYEQVLATVQERARHLRRIVEALLFLARADSDARLPELEGVELTAWLTEHRRRWADHARADELVVEAAVSEPPWVEVQPALLAELLDILLDNATKYSPPGTPILVQLQREKEMVCLRVKDQGSGIHEKDLPHVFEPFFRSADSRRRGIDGIGLGLSIAQRLARAFGGSLSVTSCLGQGSCFTLCLPRRRD